MKLSSKKGFTLIELIIVIAILGIIALIAIPNLAGIRQRSQVSADKRTAEQVGKAVRIWLTDVDAAVASSQDRKITGTFTKYDTLTGLTPDYISAGYTASSYDSTNASYYVGAYESQATAGTNNSTQKVIVAIMKSGDTAPTIPSAGTATDASIDYKGGEAGIAYIEQ